MQLRGDSRSISFLARTNSQRPTLATASGKRTRLRAFSASGSLQETHAASPGHDEWENKLDSLQEIFKTRKRKADPRIAISARRAPRRRVEMAFQLFHQLQQEGEKPSNEAYVRVLLECCSPEALALGKKVHEHIIGRGIESDDRVQTALVVMYCKCGSIEDARTMFIKMHRRSVVTWTAMIGACARHGYGDEGLKLFHDMQREGVKPNKITFISILKAFSSRKALALGKQVHAIIVDFGFESNVIVGNALVSMYGKCDSIKDAQMVFDKMQQRDLASWNAMISAYARHGLGAEAFNLFHQMQEDGVKPDKITFISILKACSSPETLELGKKLHALIVHSGIESDYFVRSALVSMYSKCGSMENASRVFNKIPQQNVASWNAMIAACVRHGHHWAAFNHFHKMHEEGVKPNKNTFISILNACSSPEALGQGKQVHELIASSGVESVDVGSALISMYVRCGSIGDAWRVFNKMPQQSVGSWNVMLAACVRHGYGEEALKHLHQMLQQGVKPDKITILSLLSACSGPEALALGKQVHALILDGGVESDMVLGTSLVSMYGNCGSVEDARRVFEKMHQHDVVSWTAMIAACARNGYADEVLNLLHIMQQKGVKPDKIFFVSILNACSRREDLSVGKQVHAHTADSELGSDAAVGNALVSFFSRCGSEDVQRVFNKMSQRDVASWNAMIALYARHGHGEEALTLFKKLRKKGVMPDKITFISILNTCTSLKALALGKEVHAMILASGIELDVAVGNALLSMYWKCGSVLDARKVFDRMHQRDVISWNSMITGCVQHGFGLEALKLLEKMQHHGVEPDKFTFANILKGCSSPEDLAVVHAIIVGSKMETDRVLETALVNTYIKLEGIKEARRLFDKICRPDVASWNTMIAAYAQHGNAKEAFKLFHGMQQQGVKPDKITFISILNACSSPEILALGKQVHALVAGNGIESDVVVGTALVSMYGKCKSIEDAWRVFNKMHPRDVAAWNAMVGACARLGYGDEALKLLLRMQQEGLKANSITFISILNACSRPEALALGKQVHTLIAGSEVESDVAVKNALARMYSKCERNAHSQRVFSNVQQWDVVL